jgi:hypothetical protein
MRVKIKDIESTELNEGRIVVHSQNDFDNIKNNFNGVVTIKGTNEEICITPLEKATIEIRGSSRAEAYSTSAYRMKLMHECLNHADYDETDVVVPLPVIGRVRISLKSPSPLEIV